MYNITRSFVLAICLACTQLSAFAQDKTQGMIHYEITYNIHASLKPDQLQYKDLIPETVVEKAELIYKGQKLKTYYNNEVKKEDEGVSTNIKVSTEEGNEKYVDIAQKKLWWVDKEKTPAVLVEKPLGLDKEDTNGMTESAETQKILDYTCKKLVIKSKQNGTVILWYTTELPLKAGSPFRSFTDKGVVLAMESKKVNYKATGIEFVPVADEDVTPPSAMKVIPQK